MQLPCSVIRAESAAERRFYLQDWPPLGSEIIILGVNFPCAHAADLMLSNADMWAAYNVEGSLHAIRTKYCAVRRTIGDHKIAGSAAQLWISTVDRIHVDKLVNASVGEVPETTTGSHKCSNLKAGEEDQIRSSTLYLARSSGGGFAVRSSEFLQAASSSLFTMAPAAWCTCPSVVLHQGFRSGAFRPHPHTQSNTRALLKVPVLSVPPISAISGNRLGQYHKVSQEYHHPEKKYQCRKEFQHGNNFQALRSRVFLAKDVQRRRVIRIQASADGQALSPSDEDLEIRDSSTETAESQENGEAKKLCTLCNHVKPLRNFEWMRASADELHLLCRACMATVRAKRSGRPLHHLDISVEEAWERARVCWCCKQRQELRDFVRNVRYPDGIDTRCRSCGSDVHKRRPRIEKGVEPQECSVCRVVKPADEFHANSKALTGLHAFCKSCHFMKYEQRLQEVNASLPVYRAAMKRCFKCRKEKSRSEFNKRKVSLDELDTYCKECRKRVQLKARAKAGGTTVAD